MGYFDGLTSGSFKTDPDGRRLFFPWGVLGGGYTMASERDYQRLRRGVKGYVTVTLAAIIIAGVYSPTLAPPAAAAVLVCFYFGWMWRLLPTMKRSDETLSLHESLSSQARAHSAVQLWLLEFVSLTFAVSGIAIFISDPGSRLMAVFCTAFFGLCAAKIGRMIVLRRSVAPTKA
jgi:hypothetical protein